MASNIIEEYRKRPIPDQSEAVILKSGYRAHPIDFSHPLINQPGADANAFDIFGIDYYWRTDNPPYNRRIESSSPEVIARVGILETLRDVNEWLKEKADLEFIINSALRSMAVQMYFHETWMPEQLKKDHPEIIWTPDKIKVETEKVWALPSLDKNSPSPHFTGGAADVGLIKRMEKKGKGMLLQPRERLGGDVLELPMGCGFDDVRTDEKGRFYCSPDYPGATAKRRRTSYPGSDDSVRKPESTLLDNSRAVYFKWEKLYYQSN